MRATGLGHDLVSLTDARIVAGGRLIIEGCSLLPAAIVYGTVSVNTRPRLEDAFDREVDRRWRTD